MTSVCAGVLLNSGKILLARRAPGRRHAGQWEFPGGRIEAGETPAAALARELREEFGIEAEVGAEAARSRHAYDTGEIELIALLVPRFAGELKPVDHDALAWVEAKKLLEYDLVPADIAVAKVLAAHRRRGRYRGTHPRRFEEKYKELNADAEALAKAKERGSTPAGMHLPVMLKEVLEALEPLDGARVLDCTLGWGGHAAEVLRRGGLLVALDKDGEELARTAERLGGAKAVFRHADYADARRVLSELAPEGADALLADLGVSSMQLDRPDRGMSFKNDGPLDMRMDRSRGRTAAEWLAQASEDEVTAVLERFGEEPDARRIAAVLAGRKLKTTGELAAAVAAVKGLGPGRLRKRNAFSHHPAARTFQALRIAVNGEHDSLEKLLADLPRLLRRGGRAVFLTFHSLEESLVGNALNSQAPMGVWRTPLEAPRRPSPQEVRENPRARSARLWRAVRI